MAKLADLYVEELRALRRAYSQALPEKARALEESAAAAWSADGWNRDGLARVLHLAHRLAGSAAIYGFPRVSRSAAELEAYLLSILEGDVSPGQGRGRLLGLVGAVARTAWAVPGRSGGRSRRAPGRP